MDLLCHCQCTPIPSLDLQIMQAGSPCSYPPSSSLLFLFYFLYLPFPFSVYSTIVLNFVFSIPFFPAFSYLLYIVYVGVFRSSHFPHVFLLLSLSSLLFSIFQHPLLFSLPLSPIFPLPVSPTYLPPASSFSSPTFTYFTSPTFFFLPSPTFFLFSFFHFSPLFLLPLP